MDRITLKALNWGIALACLGTASAANAVEPRFYQLGDGGAVAPHVRLDFGNDNNPLRANSGSQEAMFLRLQPSARYLVRQRNNSLTLAYTGEYVQYFQEYCQGQGDAVTRPGDCLRGSPTFDKASFQNHTVGLNGVLEVSSRLRATLTAASFIEHQPIGTGQSASVGALNNLKSPEAWHRQVARAEVSYGAERARGEVRAGVTLANKEFVTSNDGANLDNLNENSVAPDIKLLYRIGTRTQLFAGIGTAEVSSKGTSARNITRQNFGVEFDSSAITSGSFTLSNSVEDFDSERRDLKYLGWNVELSWSPRRYSTLTIGGGRESEGGLLNDGIGLTTSVDAEWKHQWRERFSTRAQLGLEYSEDVDRFSENVGSDELPLSFRFEGNYNIRRWLDVGAFIVIDSRSGEKLTYGRDEVTRQLTDEIIKVEDREFGRTQIGITLNGTI